ncbi:hypothetical protein [Alteromonas lipolytica]|uniref:Uncharacterized protein n=1 Tax=Alteromonas lipolytica TaxID=1856405 RepID=A0A1E8FIJ3_9ALTE|nr:hypothetical protein [Alteromonas lipolytica]OFI35739.1 hypothetical protein BFC17_10660 [Alteromonas lipolytica]GGF80362.1 hypothetical protein GCM10011338_35790 [Alteromonas lipolytica]
MRLIHWMYLGLLFVPALFHLWSKIAADSGGLASRYAPLLATVLLAGIVIGWVNQKTWLRRGFWRFSFWLLAVLLALVVIYCLISLMSGTGGVWLVWLLLGVIVMLPAMWCLWRYSARSNSCWERR